MTPPGEARTWGRSEAVNSRWLHLLALDDQLAQLEPDSAVVDDPGDLAYTHGRHNQIVSADSIPLAPGPMCNINNAPGHWPLPGLP
jgi:hypothetical protein